MGGHITSPHDTKVAEFRDFDSGIQFRGLDFRSGIPGTLDERSGGRGGYFWLVGG